MQGAPAYDPTPVAATPSYGLTCFAAASQVNGLYRNCAYRCGAGGVVYRTIGAADICPVTTAQ